MLIIKGDLSYNKTITNKFIIPLTYPEGISLTCSFVDSYLECYIDKEFEDSIIIEKNIIKDGVNELFILDSIYSENKIKCENGALKKAETKEDVSISFRQVSKLQNTNNGLSFFFAAFVNKNLVKNYQIIMKVIIQILGQEVEKNAICTLNKTVSSSSFPVQGDFICEVSLESDEQKKFNSSDPEAFRISNINDNIGGCSELSLEESSPKATDYAIAENSNKTELTTVIDFSLEENKDKISPKFEIENLNITQCSKNGKIKVRGKFSENITQEMTFEIPMSYPSAKIRCTVVQASANNLVDIICKSQKEFNEIKSIIFEPRLVKKKRREMFFIKSKKIDLLKKFDCINFNKVKLTKARNRYLNPPKFTFLQIGRPSQFVDLNILFYLALTKISTSKFETLKFSEAIITIEKSSRLRLLDEKTLDLNIKCNLASESSSGDTATLNCDSSSESVTGSITKIELNNDNINGLPDEVNILNNPEPDYSNKTNLDKIDDLPKINITNITGYNCSSEGKFIIMGKVINGTLSEKYQNFNITLDNPDSKGICSITNINNLEMTCENMEEFSVSKVYISSQIVQNIYNKPLFKIDNNIISNEQFSCIIGDNSFILIQPDNTNTNSSIESDIQWPSEEPSYYNRKQSGTGLSGGAIAGIVISCVAVAAIVTILIVLVKKGILFGKKIPLDNSKSSYNNISYSHMNNINNTKN